MFDIRRDNNSALNFFEFVCDAIRTGYLLRGTTLRSVYLPLYLLTLLFSLSFVSSVLR